MSDERERLREHLADLAHERWRNWMIHLFRFCYVDEQGHWIMDQGQVDRWRWQVQRPYEELSEAEKESDRAEADRVLALLPQGERDALMAALVQEYAAILRERGVWAELGYEATVQVRRGGACFALQRVAERLGVTDLHERAAEGVARGEEGEEP